jgi:hypothetical protein
VIDHLGGSGGSAQIRDNGPPARDARSGPVVEAELLASLVDRSCVLEHGWAGDPEVLQDALDGTACVPGPSTIDGSSTRTGMRSSGTSTSRSRPIRTPPIR